jgi:hypothetical protein
MTEPEPDETPPLTVKDHLARVDHILRTFHERIDGLTASNLTNELAAAEPMIAAAQVHALAAVAKTLQSTNTILTVGGGR